MLWGEYSELNVNIQPMKKLLLLVILFASICSGQAQNEKGYYVKHLEFPQNATLQEKVDMAARLVPTPQQLAWQQMELTAFCGNSKCFT